VDETTRWIRNLRPPRATIPDPWHAVGWSVEEERTLAGPRVSAVTVFLTGAECPFTCVFCDLWRHTLPGATPPGALPAQLAEVLEALPERLARKHWGEAPLKLYNASNFFEDRAVPPQDDAALAHLAAPFGRTIVECHPRLVLAREVRCRTFAERLGDRLEVALGLETVHPEALPQLNKKVRREDFHRAATALRSWGIAVRAFVLLGAPHIPTGESVEWTVRSVGEALDAGAEHVAIIPVRGGNGALEALAQQGAFTPPTLPQLEAALEQGLRRETGRGVVAADLWDLETFRHCEECFAKRRERLQAMNLRGTVPPPVVCPHCATDAS
jgi:archaeosine synthase beta-subunit